MALRYFIPDWDDRVDPNYDFLTDSHTRGRNPYRDDRYAHELYKPIPYDGILLSRATLDQNRRKRQAIIDAGSVHRYLRLPQDGQHQVLGDCGAFSYVKKEVPPYTTADVLDYYQDLGFDLGVSIDHLIFAELEAERERRWQLTIANAEEFLKLHRSGRYRFTPVGVAQGWDPKSYQDAVKALGQMGYTYIAIGGLVRSSEKGIVDTLTAVEEVLPRGMQVHLFGVTRPELIKTFASLGITSFDSASRLRRAWMDGRQNYFLKDDSFTAIRIPEARRAARKFKLDEAEARRLEQTALKSIRAYDRNEATLDETHQAIAAYATLCGVPSRRVKEDYLRTLKDRPWRSCSCEICSKSGVEVIIFRGNNRNRRRGFHNTWQLYHQLQSNSTKSVQPTLAKQLALAYSDERS